MAGRDEDYWGKIAGTFDEDQRYIVGEAIQKTIQKADCENTALPAGAFDTAIMINLIHIIENPLNALLECHRILKTRGKLLVISYTMHSMEEIQRDDLAMRFLEKWGMPLPYFKGNLSPDQIAVLLEKAGFLVEESKTIGEKTKALCLRARKE